MPQSLSSWCKDNDLSKTTVHTRCKELKIDTSQGLSDEAIDRLSLEFNVVSTEASEYSETEVIPGNHRIPGELAVMSGKVDLGHLRKDATLTVFGNNALSRIDAAVDLVDQVVTAIDDDLEYQKGVIKQTQDAAQKLKRKQRLLAEKRTQYTVESNLLGVIQAKETANIQEVMDEIKAMTAGDDG